MTLVEDRPVAAEAQPPEPAPAPADSWLTTADHKRLGLLFVYLSLLFLVAGGVVGIILRAHLAEPSSNILSDESYFRLFSAHATLMTMLFLAPMWVGLATYLVPLQIGANRLALPRLHAFSLWLYLAGGGCLVTSYIIGPPVGLGITGSLPLPITPDGTNQATKLWIASLALVAIAALISSINLVVTPLSLRTEGMTMLRLPAFTWASLVTGFITLISTPVFLAGLLLLYLDQRYGGSFFDTGTKGSQIIWQHTVWLFGRPEIYLLTLPALGAASDIVATHARRPLLEHRAAIVLLGAFGVLSLGAWAAGDKVANAVVLPTYSVAASLVVAPLGLLLLLWLGTLAQGRPRFHVSLLFVAGYVLLLVVGAGNVVAAAVKTVNGGTAWSVGHLHIVAFGAPTLVAVGALYHWAPKLWGRKLSAGLGSLVFLTMFGGFLVMGLSSYLLGYDGAPGLVPAVGNTSNWQTLNRVAAAGGALVLLGTLLFLVEVVRATVGRSQAVGDDPYEGLTLEWATTSPPPAHNFDNVPEVRSAAPLADVRAADAKSEAGGA
jgi:cytochrome c oxidase subunit I